MKNEMTAKHKTPYLNKSDFDLLLLFHSKNWNRMRPKARMHALQEVENRRALADGRPALKIYSCSMPPDHLGSHVRTPKGEELIVINSLFLTSGKLSQFTGAGALGTVLHEGRHAFQSHAIRTDRKDIPDAQKIDWTAVMGEFGGLYTDDPPIFYYLQSIEMDARRFARYSLLDMYRMFKNAGIEDQSLDDHLQKLLERECTIIDLVRQHLTLESIDKYEQMVLNHLRKTRPDLDLKNLRPFDHARVILQNPTISDPLQILELLDKMADDNLGIQNDKKPDKLTESRIMGAIGLDELRC